MERYSSKAFGLYSVTFVALSCLQGVHADWAAWQGLRGAQIQKTFVLEGGQITNATWDGARFQNTSLSNKAYGFHYFIDLTKDFHARQDSIEDYMHKQFSPADDPSIPNFWNGALFANDYQYCTFGGLADRANTRLNNTVDIGRVYGIQDPTLDIGLVRDVDATYVSASSQTSIAYSAYASQPDSGMGFLFSGLVGNTSAQLLTTAGDNESGHPTIPSISFYKVQMTNKEPPIFTAAEFPPDASPRAEGALVWLPYGRQGVLVTIGGTVIPGDSFVENAPAQFKTQNSFMTELEIYDIDAGRWYKHNTTIGKGGQELPGPSAGFCTAVVPSQDNASYEIFVYGGYDGTYETSPNVRDDVWILSVPAFVWTKFSTTSTKAHGRQGHVCFAPNPSTLITVGGSGVTGAPLGTNTLVDVLNLNNGNWTSEYNSKSMEPFAASSDLQSQLEWSNASGPGLYKTISSLSTELNALFSQKYSGTIKTYYPYNNDNSTNGTSPSPPVSDNPPSKPNPWKIPVIASLCTVVPVFLIALAIFCVIRRRNSKKGMARRSENRRNVTSWFGKDNYSEPEKSYTSEQTAVESPLAYHSQPKTVRNEIYEAAETGAGGWQNSGQMSPGLSSVTATSQQQYPYEMMDNPMTISDHPLYPRSISGNHIRSVHSDSISSPAEIMTSPGTMTQSSPPSESQHGSYNASSRTAEDMRLDHTDTGSAVSPPTGPVGSTIPRKPIGSPNDGPDHNRPGHRRNMSSLSEDIPNLPSPAPGEDRRQSRHIAGLPEIPGLPAREGSREGSGRMSAYKENFDDEIASKKER